MITVLAGGTGSAKFVRGLTRVIPQDEITVIVNVGDDFALHGLSISPDLDTIVYALAGVLDAKRGWGVKKDTFNCLDLLKRYRQPTWFNLGDKDLATHVFRTLRLREGYALSAFVKEMCKLLKVTAHVFPASNDRIETWIKTAKGILHLQDFWVRRKGKDNVKGVYYEGSETAHPIPEVLDAIRNSTAIFVSPANPITSIAPILAVQSIRKALLMTRAPKLAVSPIVGRTPVSGPAGKLMRGLGFEVSPLGVAHFYVDFLDHLLIHKSDHRYKRDIEKLGVKCHVTDIVMTHLKSEQRLASLSLDLAGYKAK